MRRDWEELQREGGEHPQEREQRIRKGSEHDIHVEQRKAGEKQVGRVSPYKALSGHNEGFVDYAIRIL